MIVKDLVKRAKYLKQEADELMRHDTLINIAQEERGYIEEQDLIERQNIFNKMIAIAVETSLIKNIIESVIANEGSE